MAKTQYATSDGEVRKAWDERLFRDSVKEAYFSRFMGEGPNSAVQVKTELEKKQGDRITFTIRMRLSGAGKTSGQQLEGFEEALTTYTSTLTLEEYCHAVRDKGPLDRQRAAFSIDTVCLVLDGLRPGGHGWAFVLFRTVRREIAIISKIS